jgi:teichoic acid transport system ATP-binding protein
LVTRYCTKAYLLEKGKFHARGNVIEVVDEYNRLLVNCSKRESAEEGSASLQVEANTTDAQSTRVKVEWQGKFKTNPQENRYGNGKATILEAGIFDGHGNAVQTLIKGEAYEFRMKVVFNETVMEPIFAYTVKDVKGFDITGTNTLFQNIDTGIFHKGDCITIVFRHRMILGAGGYLLSLGCAGYEGDEYVIYERRYDYMIFEIISEKPNVGFLDLESVISLQRLTGGK